MSIHDVRTCILIVETEESVIPSNDGLFSDIIYSFCSLHRLESVQVEHQRRADITSKIPFARTSSEADDYARAQPRSTGSLRVCTGQMLHEIALAGMRQQTGS